MQKPTPHLQVLECQGRKIIDNSKKKKKKKRVGPVFVFAVKMDLAKVKLVTNHPSKNELSSFTFVTLG